MGELILRHTDNLSKTLQNPELSAFEGQETAEMTCKTLDSIRNDESFDLFWQNTLSLQSNLDVSDPVLPRKRRVPSRIAIGSGQGHHPAEPKDYFRQQYFECLDLITNYIRDRMNQPGYQTLKNIEELLLKAVRKEDFHEELKRITKFFHDDFSESNLCTHLQVLGSSIPATDQRHTIKDIVEYIRLLSPAQRCIMSEVCTLVKILLTSPASNAASERSASVLRRVKTYLRSTMTQQRLNNLMVIHVHKDKTANLDLKLCLNDFISGSEHRSSLFEQY